MTDENEKIAQDHQLRDELERGVAHWLEMLLFGNAKEPRKADPYKQNELESKAIKRYWNIFVELVFGRPSVDFSIDGCLGYYSVDPVDLSDRDFYKLPSAFDTEYVPDESMEGAYHVEFLPRELSTFEQFISALYEKVKPSWLPQENSRLAYFAQSWELMCRHIDSIRCFENIPHAQERLQTFGLKQHQLFTALSCDLVSSLIDTVRPALLLMDKNGRSKFGYVMDALMVSFSIHEAFDEKRPETRERLERFLGELEEKYPDLPIGLDLYDRPLSEQGHDFLDFMHFGGKIDDKRYQSFSLWQLLRKAAYYEDQRPLDHARLWSYALDLGVLNARFVAIDLQRPLGARILEEIRTGQMDPKHALYRDFHIYRQGEYLFALLRDHAYFYMPSGKDEAFPEEHIVFDDRILREVPLSWRPESLVDYDYSEMELLHVPPASSPKRHAGWYCSSGPFEETNLKYVD